MSSFLVSLLLAGGLGGAVGASAVVAGDASAVRVSPQRGKKPSRRSSRRPAPPPVMPAPPSDDLPLGAQDLLRNGVGRPTGDAGAGAPERDGGASGYAGENMEGESGPSPEEVWRRAVEQARYELREAEEEKQRQDNADNPPMPGQDATFRVVKARENLRRLLEEGKAKQYRERPAETQP